MLLDPFGDLGEMLVLLADVVFFAEVDEVDDWFSGEEEEGVDDFDLGRLLARFGWELVGDYVIIVEVVCQSWTSSQDDALAQRCSGIVRRAGIISSFIALVHHESVDTLRKL